MKASVEVLEANTKVITHERQVPDMFSVQTSYIKKKDSSENMKTKISQYGDDI